MRDGSEAGHDLPLVSCLCLTYRRPARDQFLLEEAIESFLRQTYPNKELVILNDCPGQVLSCDAPGLRIYNVPNRFNSVGEKRNTAVALAKGNILAPWDDDDISLPWRLDLSVERLGDADYYSPGVIWVSRDGSMQREPIWYFAHVASMFTREGFQKIGGYRAISFGEDLRFDEDLRVIGRPSPFCDPHLVELPAGELFYLYRAGSSANHLSRAHNPFRWDEIGSRPIDQGHFTLRPHWRTDYVALTRRQVEVRRRAAAGDRNPDSVVMLVGGMTGLSAAPELLRPFPLLEAEPGEQPEAHARRVKMRLDAATVMGGTHLMVGPAQGEWFTRYPYLLDYLIETQVFLPEASRHAVVFMLQGDAVHCRWQ